MQGEFGLQEDPHNTLVQEGSDCEMILATLLPKASAGQDRTSSYIVNAVLLRAHELAGVCQGRGRRGLGLSE